MTRRRYVTLTVEVPDGETAASVFGALSRPAHVMAGVPAVEGVSLTVSQYDDDEETEPEPESPEEAEAIARAREHLAGEQPEAEPLPPSDPSEERP